MTIAMLKNPNDLTDQQCDKAIRSYEADPISFQAKTMTHARCNRNKIITVQYKGPL